MGIKVRIFPGAGLSVPCERGDWIHFLVGGCGRIKKERRGVYATNFIMRIIYMDNCVVRAIMRRSGSLCWLTMLRVLEKGSENGGEVDDGAQEEQ